jgi:uncharacterized protein
MDAKLKEQYKDIIQSKNLILLSVAGSAMLGLESGDKSDRDEVGVYIESMEEVAGFSADEHLVWRSAEARTGHSGEPSKAGDVDLTLYGLRKFLRLALGSNPSIINILFAPERSCLVLTESGKELQNLRKALVNKNCGKAFMGYMNQQRLRMLGERASNVNRNGLVEKYGFDTKFAMHMIRLGYQGQELLQRGTLQIPMGAETAGVLKQIKNGEFDKDWCLREAESCEQRIKRLMDTTALRGAPDFDAVEKWMLGVYKHAWFENEKAPQQQGIEADPQG